MSITKQKTKLISIAVGIAVILALALLIGLVVRDLGMPVSAAASPTELTISPAGPLTVTQGVGGTFVFTAAATNLATATDLEATSWILSKDGVLIGTATASKVTVTIPASATAGTIFTIKASLLLTATPTELVAPSNEVTITVKAPTAPPPTGASLTLDKTSATGYRGGSVNFTASLTFGTNGTNYAGGIYKWHEDSANGNTSIAYDSNGNATLYIAANDYSSVIKVWCTYEVAGLTTLTSQTASVTVTSQPTGGGSYPTGGGYTVVPDASISTVNTDKTKANVVPGTFEIKDDGIMYVTLVPADINLSVKGNFVVSVSKWDYINIPISADVIKALGDKDLEISTEFGAILIPNEFLKANSGGITVSIKFGSVTLKVLDKDGKEIADYNYPVTVILPYTLKDGEDTANVVGYKVDGGIYPLGLYNAKTGTISFGIRTPGTYDVKYNKVTFSDADAAPWAVDYINFVAARGIFVGSANFNPDEKITRASFANELAKLDGVDLSKYMTSSFSDIPAGASYLAAVEWAVESKMIEGMGDGKFGPDALVTREQMAALFTRYLNYRGIELEATVAPAAFDDNDSISIWAVDSVELMQTTGIIIGKPDNVFDPQGVATKAEIAVIFERFINAVNK